MIGIVELLYREQETKITIYSDFSTKITIYSD